MSALAAYVQTYNINYLINISGAVAASYALCKTCASVEVPKRSEIPVFFMADRWIGFAENDFWADFTFRQ
jgi:hypothetical protein